MAYQKDLGSSLQPSVGNLVKVVKSSSTAGDLREVIECFLVIESFAEASALSLGAETLVREGEV